MECLRCGNEKWYLLSKKIDETTSSVERVQECSNCFLIIKTIEVTLDGSKQIFANSKIYETVKYPNANVRYRKFNDYKVKTIETIKYVLEYNTKSNSMIEIAAKDFDRTKNEGW